MTRKYLNLMQALTPEQRLRKCSEMFDTARTLAKAHLANEPNPGNLNLRSRLFLRLYGNDFSPEEQERILSCLA